jgi:hypothetical protein
MTGFRSPRAFRRGVLFFSAVTAAVVVASCNGDLPGPGSDSTSTAVNRQELSVASSGFLELDRNAVDSNGAPGPDDWSTLFAGGGSADAYVFVSDKGRQSGTAVLDPIFKSASDVNEISTWNWVVADSTKPGALPPKDNTTNAYAAAYHNGDMFLFFGQDRFTANGTSDIGFWFLKSEVGLVPAGCDVNTAGCTGSFSGTHEIGDVLVLSAFTNGGHVDTIEVYEWVGSGGNAGGGALELKYFGTDADCTDLPPAGATACATVNQKDEDAPWTYLAGETGSASGIFPQRHFFEGGVNLSALGLEGCFSTFLSETRSSSSLTAQLKDFAFGAFNVCKIGVDKTGPALSKVGDSKGYTFTISNTGGLALVLRSISDDRIGDLKASALANGCSPLAAGASCTFTAGHAIPAGAPDPYVNTVVVLYSESATASRTYSATANHDTNLFQPSIALAMNGDALSKVGDVAHYGVTLSNTSSADTPALLCSISAARGTLSEAPTFTLASGASKALSIAYTVVGGDPDPLGNSASATCTPTGFPNKLEASAGHSVNLFQPSIAILKGGPAFSKAGDTPQYAITLTNTSSSDTPPMTCSITDTLAGVNRTGVVLASGASDVTPATFTVPAAAPDPLVNRATANCTIAGFPNTLDTAASFPTDLIHPSFTVSQACLVDPVPRGSPAQFQLIITNSGDADLQFAVDNAAALGIAGTYSISSGSAALSLIGSVPVPAGATSVSNTSTVEISLGAQYGLPNKFTASASASCSVPTEGCTPGSWKNSNGRLQLWDEAKDPLAIAAGFYTGTSFHTYFGVSPSVTGLSSTLTMVGAINLGGGGVEKLARHGVAGLLSVAAGLNYLYPPGTSDLASLKAAIATALATKTYEPLASQLAQGNQGICPIP